MYLYEDDASKQEQSVIRSKHGIEEAANSKASSQSEPLG